MPHPQPASASARFLDESVLPIFTDLRMTAFGQSVIDIAADPAFDDWSFSDKVLYALDKEVAAKRERRVNKLLKASRSPNPDACVEDIVYTPSCQMRVFGTGVPETRYCRVPGSWYRGRADGVGPAVCFIRPDLLGRWPCACRSLRCGFGGRC